MAVVATNTQTDERIEEDGRILLVDDDVTNTVMLERMLRRWGHENVISTNDSSTVLELCEAAQPDLVLLDLQMPPPDGFELLETMPHTTGSIPLPVVVLTGDVSVQARRRALAAGASDFLTKPFDIDEVRLRVRNLLHIRRLAADLQAHRDELEERVAARTQELERSRLETLERLALAAEYRDDDTGQHTRRVARTAVVLAERLGVPEIELSVLELAAPLHDVGKIGVPDTVLLKPDRLTSEEFAAVKRHVVVGGKILGGSSSPVLQLAETIALHHHERWDGGGYPHGLVNSEIPVAARLVAVADVFDALTHERPYKHAWDTRDAAAEIVAQGGSHFDPEIVEEFARLDHDDLLMPVAA